MIKRCNKCNKLKALEEFPKNSKATYCKECKNEQTRQWRFNNRDYIKEYNAIHNPTNYPLHKNQMIKTARIWNLNNSERRKAIVKKNNAKNPAKRIANCNKRRASKIQATPKWLTNKYFEQIEDFYIQARILTKITGIKHVVDHTIPLKHKNICGLHVPWNLQILTHKENSSKKNSFDGTYKNEKWKSI